MLPFQTKYCSRLFSNFYTKLTESKTPKNTTQKKEKQAFPTVDKYEFARD